MVWESLVTPDLKLRWMDMLSVDVERPEGRIGPGSGYHCVHDAMEFRYWVTDWEPFDYFSTLFSDPLHEGLKLRDTYQLEPTESGTEVRHAMGSAFDDKGQRHPTAEAELAVLLGGFWPPVFDELERLLSAAD